jgi:hypothetical protein
MAQPIEKKRCPNCESWNLDTEECLDERSSMRKRRVLLCCVCLECECEFHVNRRGDIQEIFSGIDVLHLV